MKFQAAKVIVRCIGVILLTVSCASGDHVGHEMRTDTGMRVPSSLATASSNSACLGISDDPDAIAKHLIVAEKRNDHPVMAACPNIHEHVATTRELAKLGMCFGAKGISDSNPRDESYQPIEIFVFNPITGFLDARPQDNFYYSRSGYKPPGGALGDPHLMIMSNEFDGGNQVLLGVGYMGALGGYGFIGLGSESFKYRSLCMANNDGSVSQPIEKATYFKGPNCQDLNDRFFKLVKDSEATYASYGSCSIRSFPMYDPACATVPKCKSTKLTRSLKEADLDNLCSKTELYQTTKETVRTFIEEIRTDEAQYHSMNGGASCPSE